MDSSTNLPDLTNAVEWAVAGYQLHSTCMELILERDRINGEFLSSPLSICKLNFELIASFAVVDLSRMWEYFRDGDDNPPVIQVIPYDGKRTFVDGFTLNGETCIDWKHIRVSSNSEVFEVISREMPIITPLELDYFKIESTQ